MIKIKINNSNNLLNQRKMINEMSKENAEQLLNSVMQDEKGVQDKIRKATDSSRKTSGKDW